MRWIDHDGIGLNTRVDGPVDAPVLFFLNSLGTDLRMWDAVVADLSHEFMCLRMDTRGHGLSDAPKEAYSLEMLARDAECVLNAYDIQTATVVGISIGGAMAQKLALWHPERVKALVLANTAPKFGSPEAWQARICAIREGGLASIETQVFDRWFSDPAATLATGPWRNMLLRTPEDGYIGCCEALKSINLTDQIGRNAQPALVVAGGDDLACPPTAVRAGADLMRNARYVEMPGIGHLPPIEDPDAFLSVLRNFLQN